MSKQLIILQICQNTQMKAPKEDIERKRCFATFKDIDPSGEATTHERILSVVSTIGCVLSLVGLTLTMIAILMLK